MTKHRVVVGGVRKLDEKHQRRIRRGQPSAGLIADADRVVSGVVRKRQTIRRVG